jgi:hypothetical protein
MVEIEDILPSMQPHVVGAPWMWVQLFLHLANAVDQQGQQAPSLVRLNLLHAKGTTCIFFRA